ncbi:hypothetical protein O3M35_002674 [Rhynocoris fuscipes]|uniref:Uncharacterized protein n=1 Tax=Rhynocoris fuscipes TaxID=488301 RepID=A0AAW1CML9_9HEMI
MIRYANCSLKAYYFPFAIPVNASAGDNSVDIQISLGSDGSDCLVTLDHIKIDRLDHLYISIGGGVAQNIANKIIKWLSSYYNELMIAFINKTFSDVTATFLPQVNICTKLPTT